MSKVEGLCRIVEGLYGIVEGLYGIVEGLYGIVEGLYGKVEGLYSVHISVNALVATFSRWNLKLFRLQSRFLAKNEMHAACFRR
jgi:hypothetical protein